ncbi:MAG: phenylacetate-CoA oxygenase subunit PaaC [Hyphomicrobiales bacterium]|nr:phenylacetate-CoA oxygenase subunit PaaC [Hyphomicrobiales bacterium]
MTTGSITLSDDPLVRFILRRADDALVLGHRLSEWCGHAPLLEEEMALANIALDHLGQARALYSYAAEVEAAGHDEDAYAYRRDPVDYLNLLLVERPNGDFAHTIVRLWLYSAFMSLWWQAMTASKDAQLAALAARAVKEVAYHLRHASNWVVRLGDGTPESLRRAQTALDLLWPYAGEMLTSQPDEAALTANGIAIDPETLRQPWLQRITSDAAQAALRLPSAPFSQQGGRRGNHSEAMGHLLAELQYMQRAYPGAQW